MLHEARVLHLYAPDSEVIGSVLLINPWLHIHVYYSCNMGTSDMYAQSPRAAGIHIRQIMSAHVTANM